MNRHCIFLLCLFTFLKVVLGECSPYVYEQGRCDAYEISCGEGGYCISMTKVCDGIDHCGDSSDELGCDHYSLIFSKRQDFFGYFGLLRTTTPWRTPITTPTTARTVTKHQSTITRSSLAFKSRSVSIIDEELSLFARRVSVKMKSLLSQDYLQAERLINLVLFEAQMSNLTYTSKLVL